MILPQLLDCPPFRARLTREACVARHRRVALAACTGKTWGGTGATGRELDPLDECRACALGAERAQQLDAGEVSFAEPVPPVEPRVCPEVALAEFDLQEEEAMETPTICACGCGREVPPTAHHARFKRIYFEKACSNRVTRERHKAERKATSPAQPTPEPPPRPELEPPPPTPPSPPLEPEAPPKLPLAGPVNEVRYSAILPPPRDLPAHYAWRVYWYMVNQIDNADDLPGGDGL